MVAYWRACESRRPDALVRDPVAVTVDERFLTPTKRRQYARSPIFETTVDVLAIRSRILDERLLHWTRSLGVAQVVNLGAGLDSRPSRLPLPAEAQVYAVDTEAVTAWAADVFQSHRPGCRLVPVAADIADAGGLVEQLERHGFRPARPTVWILEGLFEFLAPPDVTRLLTAITRCSAAGSGLLAQVLDPLLVRFARERGDGDFPFRRLDPPGLVLSQLGSWELSVLPGDLLGERLSRPVPRLFHLVEGRRRG